MCGRVCIFTGVAGSPKVLIFALSISYFVTRVFSGRLIISGVLGWVSERVFECLKNSRLLKEAT